jgi:hypothetical protein
MMSYYNERIINLVKSENSTNLCIMLLVVIILIYILTKEDIELLVILILLIFLFCKDKMEVISTHTRKVGPPNPKTLNPPVIAPRSHDLSQWSSSNLVTHSATNSAKMLQMYDHDEYKTTNIKPNRNREGTFYHPDSVDVRLKNGDLVEKYGDYRNYTDVSNFSHPDSIKATETSHHHNGITPLRSTGRHDHHNGRHDHHNGRHDHHNGRHDHMGNTSHHHHNSPIKYDPNHKITDEHIENMYNDRPSVDDDDDDSGYGILETTDVSKSDRHFNNLRLHKDKGYTSYQRSLHTSNIEPSLFAEHQVIEPISSNIGISYNPSYKYIKKSSDYLGQSDNYGYTRIDPQLIRDNESKNRLMENPDRNWWTQKYSAFDAEPGTVNADDIYDPRSNGSGDSSRAYYDTNLGQVRYYYGDVSTLRGSSGNFISRSNIDHMEYQDPMSKILPEFVRTPVEGSTRALVQNKWMEDTTRHRENMMESLMRKKNQESWQQRYAPISRSQTGRKG